MINENPSEGKCCNPVLIVDDNPFNVMSLQMILEYCFGVKADLTYGG